MLKIQNILYDYSFIDGISICLVISNSIRENYSIRNFTDALIDNNKHNIDVLRKV